MFGRRRKNEKLPETTASGQPILRHQDIERPFEPPVFDQTVRDAVDVHLEAHLGPTKWVWHEIISDLVHIDVLVWEPTPDRPMYTLISQGMSDRPMTVPEHLIALGASRRAEVMICLPPDWPMPDDDSRRPEPWQESDAYFPVYFLKMLARLPHDYGTWLGVGHTVPNGDPPQPFTDETGLTTWLVMPPTTMPDDFSAVEVDEVGTVAILSMVAIYNDELQLKLDEGTSALIPGFEAHRVTELLDIARPSSLTPV